MEPDWPVILGCLGVVVLVAVPVGAIVGARALLRSADEESARRRARQQEDQVREQERRRQRWESLCARFGPEAAERIVRGVLWQGETEEMLLASLGLPADRDVAVMKTKTRAVLKFRPLGGNRYGLRVTIENGAVVGWEEK